MENGVKEFWYFVRSEVKKLASVEPGERQKYADTLLQDLGHQERCESKSLTPEVESLDPPSSALCLLRLYYFRHCG